jgi:CRISPR/Cas system-associated exonuclease Cas4 (RecB family)
MLQQILHDFVTQYPRPDEPATLDLTVGTHDPNRDTTKFRLSDAGKCRLMRYWKRQGREATNSMSPEVTLQMQAGNLLHAYIERAVQWCNGLVDSESTLEDDHRIGHFDMVIHDHDGLIMYDIKTINSKKAYFMEKDGNRADPQHIAQIVSYAIMYPGQLDALRLAYVVRDTFEIREIEVERISSEPTVIADWQLLLDAWVDQKEPAANPSEWECKYCQYKADCLPGG